MKIISFKADDRFITELDRAARRLGLTRSELIRAALRSWLAGECPPRRGPVYRSKRLAIWVE